MEDDKEIAAMVAINTALADLDVDIVARVLRWAVERHKVTLPIQGKPKGLGPVETKQSENMEMSDENTAYEHFSDFFDAADPKTEADRVLVAAYWFQVLKNQGELESQALNKELKNTGHGVGHMPHALDDLMNAKPRLMIQLKKQGTARQARRKFKLTTEGSKKVKAMLHRTE